MHDRPDQRGRWRPACVAMLAALLSLTPGTADAAITLDAGVVLLTGSTSPSAGTVAGGTTVDITSVESLLAIAENAALQAGVNLLGLAGVTVDGTPTLADVEFGGLPTPGADLQQSLFTVRSVSSCWLFAEGATGPYFDTFLLVSNPHPVDLPVRVTYLLPDGGTKEETFVVGRQSRFNVWVDTRPGLEDSAFSAGVEVVGDGTVIAERAMWWPGDGTSWHEGHVSSDAPSAGTAWVVAQGVDGGPEHAETYVLVANVGGETASVRVDVIAEDGTSASQVITVGANSRTKCRSRNSSRR